MAGDLAVFVNGTGDLGMVALRTPGLHDLRWTGDCKPLCPRLLRVRNGSGYLRRDWTTKPTRARNRLQRFLNVPLAFSKHLIEVLTPVDKTLKLTLRKHRAPWSNA